MNRLLRSNRQRESQVRRVSCEAEGSVQEASNTAWCFGGEEQQKRVQSTSEYQTEVETELDVEEEKAAEIKNQVQTAKNSPESQQHRPATASKEVAEMQQEWRDSVKVQAAEDTRADENAA